MATIQRCGHELGKLKKQKLVKKYIVLTKLNKRYVNLQFVIYFQKYGIDSINVAHNSTNFMS